MSIAAVIVAVVALVVSLATFWLEWWKPFRMTATLRGILWQAPAGGRPDTPFSIILPLVLQNWGARPGVVQTSYIRLLPSSSKREFRLEAIVVVDPNEVIQLATAPTEEQKAGALQGIGSVIQLGKYEVKELGVHFTVPPIDAKRYQLFAPPKDFPLGDYRLEFWCCVNGGWRCYAVAPVVTVRREMLQSIKAGRPVINLSGAIYDTAPGAPRSRRVT